MNIFGKKEKRTDNLKIISPKGFFLFTLFLSILIISANVVSAIQIETNDEYSQGETLIAKITGNFVDAISPSNIFFYREHERVPTQFSIEKIETEYYLYGLLYGKGPGNYSLQIQNVRYKIGTQVRDEDVIKNFTITEESADFYVSPGFVRTKENFSLELTNLGDSSLEVGVMLENSSTDTNEGFFESLFGSGSESQTVTLSPYQTKKINLEFDDSLSEPTFKTISLESENTIYSVPVYMEADNTTSQEETGKLTFTPLAINVSIATNSNTTRTIYLNNKEDAPVENISLYVSEALEPYINISLTEISEMDENSTIKIELVISSGTEEKNLEGQITARYENDSSDELFANMPIFLIFIKDYVPANGEDIIVVNTKSCAELNGFKCGSNETCSGQSVVAFDGNCCTVQCTAKKEGGSTGKIIGWGLVVLVLAFLAWFFMKRYKKVSNPIDLLKVASGKK